MAEFNNNDTITGVCNSALAMVGQTDFIEDINGDSPVCKVLRIVLEQVCKEIQAHESAAWDELVKEDELVLKGKVSEGFFDYNLPNRMISPIECFQKRNPKTPLPFEIIGGKLRCIRDADVWLRYIGFSFNPEEWSVELKTCIIKLLAARIVSSIVKDYTGAQKLEQQFWAYDFQMWVGMKKNKSQRNDNLGDDASLSRNYWNGVNPETEIGGY